MAQTAEHQAGDFVPFYPAGTRAEGQYRCADCGYGVTIHDELPTCPMCMGTAWEAVEWVRAAPLDSGLLL